LSGRLTGPAMISSLFGEFRTANQLWQRVVAVEALPTLLDGFNEIEDG